ncbi:hypothetical protein HDU84_006256 [Entophlyctis sp. JEL0112]|nr:hypothetical protein HDU84_006256 [Entophlyctis sp. JEL0112]
MSLRHLLPWDESVRRSGLDSEHVEVLAALLDAIIPAVDPALLPNPDSKETRDFAMASASSMRAILSLLPIIAMHKPAFVKKQLRIFLWLLTTSAGSLMLIGKRTPFLELVNGAKCSASDVVNHSPQTQNERVDAMMVLCKSRLVELRCIFRDLKAFTALSVFGRSLILDGMSTSVHNPTWAALGFPGLVPPESPMPSDYNHIWQPTFINSQLQGALTEIETDVVVVGTGCGGGVLAAELSKAGHRVLVIEKGKHRRFEEYTNNELESLSNTLECSGLLQSENGSIMVLAGSGFGGGTLVNWSASLRPPHKVRREWATTYGLPFFESKAFSDSIEAVCERVGVTDVNIQHNASNRILLDGCKRLGYPSATIPQNVGSHDHRCGYCTLGCPYAQKQGTHLTLLKDAAEHGARFIDWCRVDKINHKDGRTTGVIASLLDGTGRRIAVKAKTVISSCGSVQTPQLLSRSGLKNRNIGRNLRLHPVSIIQGHFPDREIKPFYGPIMSAISTVCSDVKGPARGCAIEVPSMLPGIFAAAAPYSSAVDFKRYVLQYRNRASLIVLQRDHDSQGRVSQDAEGLTRIEFELGAEDADSMSSGLVASAKILLAAGAQEVESCLPGLPALKLDAADMEDPASCQKAQDFFAAIKRIGVGRHTQVFSAHQMSSCRMGTSPLTGAVDPKGQTWEVKGLYVADGSVLPTALGVKYVAIARVFFFLPLLDSC